MTGFPKFNVGEHVTASKLNSLADYAGIAEKTMPHQGGGFFGSQSGNSGPTLDQFVRIKQVKLTSDLPAATDPLTNPGTGTCRVIRRKPNGDFELTTEEIELVNRDPAVSLKTDDYAKIEYIDYEWQPQKSGSSGSTVNMLHGIITRSLGCGYYEVELSEWVGETPESSSVSVSVSASDSSPPNECDICDELIDVTPEAAACESEQLLPEFEEIEDLDTPRIVQRQTVGTGVIVLAFDAGSRFVPLALWSDCLMVNLGDENSQSPSGSDSTGTGTERVYQIVRGHQEHLIQHRERWECCDGVDTLVGRTPIIFPGIECPEETCNVC